MEKSFSIQGNLVDVHQKRIYSAEIEIEGERIKAISEAPPSEGLPAGQAGFGEAFILPGFIDAHVHIESSMLVPSEFAKLAVTHGTVATVSDPHEIANVCGIKGVEFMIENGNTVPFKFHFGAPSCVPATKFETTGATLNANDIDDLMKRDDILYLSEMMNFPGVLHGDAEVMKKIAAAKKYNKPVDGHAPGLRGDAAKKYIDAGISTDHECFTKEEAWEKLQHGMKIIIREGSAAKNFEALIDLLNDYPDMMMFCSDDKHPDSLVEGHINRLCARAVEKRIDLFKVLQAACVNPVNHYKLKVGLLRQNDFADFIVVRDLKSFDVLQTYINGELVAESKKSLISSKPGVQSAKSVNNFSCSEKKVEDFAVPLTAPDSGLTTAIEALDGQLITNKFSFTPIVENGFIVSDVENDILKIVVVNRYKDAPVAKAFIKNFGLKRGAIASSVAHDSHNIVAVGVDDESICKAVNLVIKNKGGIAAHPGPAPSNSPSGGEPSTQPSLKQDANNHSVSSKDWSGAQATPPPGEPKGAILSLPVAGLMSADDGYEVAKKYSEISRAAKSCGSTLDAPFMTLSFMALLVIPHLKLSDLGLFDGDEFKFV